MGGGGSSTRARVTRRRTGMAEERMSAPRVVEDGGSDEESEVRLPIVHDEEDGEHEQEPECDSQTTTTDTRHAKPSQADALASLASSLYEPVPIIVGRHPSRLNLTSLSLVLRFLTSAEHLRAAQVSLDWYRTAANKMAWTEELPHVTACSNCARTGYPSPTERPSKLLRVASLDEMRSLTQSHLTRHAQTLCIDLVRFDFTVSLSQMLVSLPSLTSLTMRLADHTQVSHAAVLTCFAHDAADGWANRLKEVCIAEYVGEDGVGRDRARSCRPHSSSTSPRPTSSSLDRGISLDYLVSSVHLLSLYLSHLDNLEVLIHAAYQHLDYTEFTELLGLERLHTIVISPALPMTRQRVENLRRLTSLRYIDWCGEGWTTTTSEGENKQPSSDAGAEQMDSWQLLLSPIQLSSLDTHITPAPVLHLAPLPLHSLHISGLQFDVHHLPLLARVLPTLESLHFSSCETLFRRTGIDLLAHIAQAWHDAQERRGDVRKMPLHTLCIERAAPTSLSRGSSRPAWEEVEAPLSPTGLPVPTDAPAATSPSPPSPLPPPASYGAASLFAVRHFSLSAPFLVSPLQWSQLASSMPHLSSLHLRHVSISSASVRALASLTHLVELCLDRCAVVKHRRSRSAPESASSSVVVKHRSPSASLCHALSQLATLTQLDLHACEGLVAKDLLLLRHATRLTRLAWTDAAYLSEQPPLPPDGAIHRARSPTSMQRHAAAWNADFLTLCALQRAVLSSSTSVSPLLPSHTRSRSLMQRLKGLARRTIKAGGSAGCLDLPVVEEQQEQVLPPDANDARVAIRRPDTAPRPRRLTVLLRNQCDWLPPSALAPMPVYAVALAQQPNEEACEPFLCLDQADP